MFDLIPTSIWIWILENGLLFIAIIFILTGFVAGFLTGYETKAYKQENNK